MENSDSGDVSRQWIFTFLALVGLCFLFGFVLTNLNDVKSKTAKTPILFSNFKRVEIETHEPARVDCVDQMGKGNFKCDWTKKQNYNLTCIRANATDNFECFYPNGTTRSFPLVESLESRPAEFIHCEITGLDGGGQIVWPSTCFTCFGEECNPANTAERKLMSKERRDKNDIRLCIQFSVIFGAAITTFIHVLI